MKFIGGCSSFAVFLLAATVLNAGMAHAQAQTSCKILKTEWSQQDEKNYQNFVVNLAQAVIDRQCKTVRECMQSSANLYRKSDPSGLAFNNDCAKLSPSLRGYFACKNGLPFSVASRMVARNRSTSSNSSGSWWSWWGRSKKNDLRYTPDGNRVAERTDFITPSPGKFVSIVPLLNEIIPMAVYSGSYRFHYEDSDDDRLFTDFYPVAINRDSIIPGTVIYDPNGHVVTVYRVEDDGRIRYIDSHPDNSLTTGVFGKHFVRSTPGQGAGFKNWRPIKLVGAKRMPEGYYVGGRIVGAKNSELANFSTVQFMGTDTRNSDWQRAVFTRNGRNLNYYDYVRENMAVGDLHLEPRTELANMMHELCNQVNDRVEAVDISLKVGLQNQAHPERLPDNIYGTSGDWETYSTPSRDARLKVGFKDVRDQVQRFVEMLANRDPEIDYTGSNLPQDLADVYRKESAACQITYTNSAGQARTMSYEELRQRLFKLSFDPYNCVELRWGATSAEELATCRDDANKKLWYEREQYLRNQIDRRYDDFMNFSLSDLATLRPGNGVARPPDVDVLGYLSTQGAQ